MLLDLGKAAPSRLYRQVREESAQAFWATPVAVTAALRRAVIAANKVLYQHNLQVAGPARCYGAISCAAVREEELFLAQAGPARAYVLRGSDWEQFPQESLPPLGAGAYTEVRVTYWPIRPGDRLLLVSQTLVRAASADGLRRALSLPDPTAVRDGLEQIAAGEDFTALLMDWAREGPPASERRRRPLTVPPPPPAVEEPVPSPLVEEPAPPPAQPDSHVPPPPPELATASHPVEASELAQDPVIRVWEPVQEEEPPQLWEATAEPELVRPRPSVQERLARLNLGRRARRVGLGLKATAAQTGYGLKTLFRRTLPGRERRPRRRQRERRPPPAENSRLMIGVAAVIPILIALLTLWAWLSFGSAVRRQQVLHQAQVEAALAQQTADPAEQRGHWETVLTILAAANMTDDPEGGVLAAEAQDAIDELDGVIRVNPTLLWSPGVEVSARRMIVHDLNIFLLDTEHHAVVQLTMPGAEGQVAGEAPAILTAGEERRGQQVASLVDMTWDKPGGEWSVSQLVVLDSASRLWLYDPAWQETVEFLPLGSAQGEVQPVAMASFEGRLYLLDPGANQVWRYWAREGGYPDRAEPYFSTGAPFSLASARDMAIDGNVYVLLGDGSIAKFFAGEIVPFDVTGVPAPAPHFVALAVSPAESDGPLYLADGAAERLVVLDPTGAFLAQLRAEPGTLVGVQVLALDEMGDRLFFLADGGLYDVPVPPLP